jgi:hypothetical protein
MSKTTTAPIETAIAPGLRFNGFEVLSVDETGKRVSVMCACGNAHTLGVEALLNGAARCPAVQSKPGRVDALHNEAKRLWCMMEMRDWQPGR